MVIQHVQRNYEPQRAVVGHGGAARKDDDLRRSEVRWLRGDDLELFWLWQRIDCVVRRANEEGFGRALSPGIPSELQFTTYYGDDEGKYGWHTDDSPLTKTPAVRKLSFCLQLSSREPVPRGPWPLRRCLEPGYTGGEFELDPNADALPSGAYSRQGDAIIFRSGIRHQVKPVTAGVRHSLVTWFKGPQS